MKKDILVELVNKNLSTRKIAKELNCSQSTVKYWLKKYKLRTHYVYISKQTPEERRAKNVIYVQRRREKIKSLSVEYKGGKCEICGYNKCIDALEFHHINPEEKDFGIASKGYVRSWEKVKKELDKCMLVCANCHREIHNK